MDKFFFHTFPFLNIFAPLFLFFLKIHIPIFYFFFVQVI